MKVDVWLFAFYFLRENSKLSKHQILHEIEFLDKNCILEQCVVEPRFARNNETFRISTIFLIFQL